MKVRVTKAFDWAPDGNHPRTVAVGEVLEGRGATVALELKSGEEVLEADGVGAEIQPPAPEECPEPQPAVGEQPQPAPLAVEPPPPTPTGSPPPPAAEPKRKNRHGR